MRSAQFTPLQASGRVYVQKENQSNHPSLQDRKMISVTSSKNRTNGNRCGMSRKLQIFGVVLDLCRVETAIDSTRRRHFHPRTKIRCLSYFTDFEKRYRFWWLSQMPLFNFVFSKDGLVCLTFFVLRSLLGVRHSKISKNWILNFLFTPLFLPAS